MPRAQVHLRHLVGGRARSYMGELPHERIFQVRGFCRQCARALCPGMLSCGHMRCTRSSRWLPMPADIPPVGMLTEKTLLWSLREQAYQTCSRSTSRSARAH